MNTSNTKTKIRSIGFGKEKMYVELDTDRVLPVPYSYTPRLANASRDDLESYRLIAGGIGVHFEAIDEDISVEGILRDFGNETKRINISFPADLLDRVDAYAQKHHMSRSALLQKTVREHISVSS